MAKVLLNLLIFLLAASGLVASAKDKGDKKDKALKPIIPIHLSEGQNATTVLKGSTIQIVCIGPHEPFETTRTEWWKDDKEIEDAHQWSGFEISRLGLTINKIQPSSSGVYKCILKDEHSPDVNNIHRNINITVVRKKDGEKKKQLVSEHDREYDDDAEYSEEMLIDCDRIRAKPGFSEDAPYLCFERHGDRLNQFHILPAGSGLTLKCDPKGGNPPPKLRWYKDDEPFSAAGYHYKISNNTLTMKEATESDSAVYSCEAYNSHSRIRINKEVKVQQVNHAKPIFTEAPKNLTVMQMGNAFLKVEILSDAEYFVMWMKHSPENPEIFETVESRTDDDYYQDSHILYLENVTLADAGWYTCLATNSIGRANMSVYLDVVTEVKTDAAVSSNEIAQMSEIVAIGIPLAAGILLLSIFAVWFFTNRYQLKKLRMKIKEGNKGWTKVVVVDRVPARDSEDGAILIPEVNIKSVPTNRANAQEYELPKDERWEFLRSRLIIGKYLGEGAFGEVCQATAHGIIDRGVTTTVAIKTLKNTHSDADMIDLISEMETMKELGKHPNIINLLGCCTEGGQLLVIMEFAEHGSLLEFLRTNRNNYTFNKMNNNPDTVLQVYENDQTAAIPSGQTALSFKDLMSYAYQVARGMDYLSQRKYVHRDLAARNVLIAANHVAKICDFGMTRSTFANDYYRKKSDGRVPIKWMAPETLIHRVYTSQSDV
ncbi:Fibroblast growth factor receptor 2 [Folsomia candida]|uniref:receptor protein-tyrosine kinase n=1 Tax=Folsomia candida TaxID=158441 RepID=A0A226DEH8_FOLCA|nr:Fibroblast growth factor receptor 2 [Folsomia candida]